MARTTVFPSLTSEDFTLVGNEKVCLCPQTSQSKQVDIYSQHNTKKEPKAKSDKMVFSEGPPSGPSALQFTVKIVWTVQSRLQSEVITVPQPPRIRREDTAPMYTNARWF